MSIRGARVLGEVDCIFCGSTHRYTENGCYCSECSLYAYLEDNGRWKVYLRFWHVPRETIR